MIKSQTWSKDSNELFDYECSDLTRNNLTTITEGYIVRTKDEINFLKDNKDIKLSRALLKIVIKDGEYYAYPTFEEKNNLEMPWISLRHLKNKNNEGVSRVNFRATF